jgi:hypothetical protein
MPFFSSFDDSPHELRTRTPDGRDLVFLTGTAGFLFQGTGGNFIRDDLFHVVGPTWARLDNVAPHAALASVFNANTAVNAGWAVDNCRFALFNNRILLIAAVAVSDSDGFLLRASYQVTAIGIIRG